MKRKTAYLRIGLALFIGVVWYNHQYHCYGYPFLTTPSGLSYKAIGKKSSGRQVQDGEWVSCSIVMKAVPKAAAQGNTSNSKEVAENEKNSAKESEHNDKNGAKESANDKKNHTKKVAESSPKERILINYPNPVFFRFDQHFQSKNKQIAEMIKMMQEKQHMIFKCAPAYYIDEKDPERLEQILKQTKLNKEDELVMDIKLDTIMTDEAYKQMIKTRQVAQSAKDKQLITDYLKAHHIAASSTDSGLFYIIDQPSDATPVVKGKTIKVHYTGRLLDGTVFDTSVEEIAKANNLYNPKRPYKPFEFQVGNGYVIQGWDEGLLLLKKHEKARFFIPSALAYGEQAVLDKIPANSILLFEVEVVDIF